MDVAYGARGDVPTTIVNNVTLTTSYVDSDAIQCAGENKLRIYLKYTQGTGESNNTLILQNKVSPDGTNYYTESISVVTTGQGVVDKLEHTYTADTLPASGSDWLYLDVTVCDQHYKLSFKEGDVAANAGTLTAIVQKGVA